MQEHLAEDQYYNFSHPDIQQIVRETIQPQMSSSEKAVALYYKIRDGWWYNPYRISRNTEEYVASNIAKRPDGHCIDKAILLIACLRAVDIPARIHLAKVKNHIAVERLEERFGTNELTPHGMVDIYLDGKWYKTSPAFNAELCEKCNVAPLEWNGAEDSVFQEYNREGAQFMEYLEDYGHFAGFPLAFIQQNMADHYPDLVTRFNQNGFLEI